MLGNLARSFMNATLNAPQTRWDAPSHWAPGERFDNRRDSELEAHTIGRRRD